MVTHVDHLDTTVAGTYSLSFLQVAFLLLDSPLAAGPTFVACPTFPLINVEPPLPNPIFRRKRKKNCEIIENRIEKKSNANPILTFFRTLWCIILTR